MEEGINRPRNKNACVQHVSAAAQMPTAEEMRCEWNEFSISNGRILIASQSENGNFLIVHSQLWFAVARQCVRERQCCRSGMRNGFYGRMSASRVWRTASLDIWRGFVFFSFCGEETRRRWISRVVTSSGSVLGQSSDTLGRAIRLDGRTQWIQMVPFEITLRFSDFTDFSDVVVDVKVFSSAGN